MRSLLLALIVALVAAVPAQADQVINLGEIYPSAINGHRQIVGGTLDNSDADNVPVHALIWNSGVLSRLAEPGGTSDSYAFGINANGRVVGGTRSASGQDHAIFWDGPSGAPRQLGPLSSGDADFSSANAVDDAGDIVGNSLDANVKSFGFFAAGGSGLTSVGEGVGGQYGTTTVAAITPDGQRMLGQVAGDSDHQATSGWYLFNSPSDGGVKLDLKFFQTGASVLLSPPMANYASLMASDGSVVGYKGDNATTGTHYLRLPNGSEQQITGLAGYNAVNAKHAVVGTIVSSYMGSLVPHAAIWKPDGTVVDLNSLLPADSDYVLADAMAINDNGDIVGFAGQISTQKAVGFLLPAGYVVDSNLDDVDKTPGDGNCLTAAGTCTLRAALQEINEAKVTTPTSIAFNLPGGNGTIKPTSALPAAKYPVAIDGNGKVALLGTNAGAASGLILQGNESTVRGMDIEAFASYGVRVEASDVSVGALPTDTPPCTFPCNTFKSNGKGAIAVASGKGNLLEGNRMTGNAKPAIDLGADGRTPNDARDVDAGANGLHNFPIGVLSEKDPVSNARKVSGVDVPDDAGEAIDIYAQSAADAARGAEPTDYVGSTTVGFLGGWSFVVPAGLPANDTFFSATITTAADGTSELSPICTDPDGDGNPDSDGDGLCDTWETTGIDADDNGTIDLTLPNASPTHKDLYVEVDTMGGQSKPATGAIQDVIDAFAAAPVLNASGGNGIALHANTTFDEEIPEAPFKVTGTGTGTLDGYKEGSLADPCDGYFGSPADRTAPDCFQRLSARALAYRWALFGNKYTEGGGSSGFAEGIGGNEFTVTLGSWDQANVLNSGGGAAQCHSTSECRRIMDAGTFMHEFGHSLGLHHGGQDEDQYKPNYLSVMNYMFQMRGRVKDRPLDYSRWALPSLDETHLTDASGILVNADLAARVGVQLFWGHTGWYKWGGNAGCQVLNAPTSGVIDWDAVPVTLVTSAVVSDNNCYSDTPAKTLKSYADWPDLRYSFRDQPGASDAPTYAGDSAVHEETDTSLLAEAARNDTDGNGVNDLADSCRLGAGSQFADANGNGFADGCEADMNALQAFPGQRNGAGGGGGGGTGGGPTTSSGPARDTTAPALSKLSAKPSTATRAKGKKKAKPATLRFTVSETSAVSFTGELVAKGHKAGKKCVAGTKKKAKACTLYKTVSGALRINAKAGANTLAFAAKLGTKKLGAGSYRLTAVAIDAAGNRSKPVTVTVTVR